MNDRDPGDRETSSGRPESPLPHRPPAAGALYALRPVPAPRTPGDGGLSPTSAAPVPAPRFADPIPRQRAVTAGSSPWIATTEPVPAVRPDDPAHTPPMPWAQVSRRTRFRLFESGVDRRVALALAVAVLLVALAALVLGGMAGPEGDPTTPADRAPVGVPDLAAGMTVVDASAFGSAEPGFRSPTGNITCRMAGDGVSCAVENRSWQLPPGVADCPPGAAGGVVLTGSGPATPSCDAAGSGSARPLDYGSALRRGDTTCVSRRDGVECRDTSSGHGFTVARATYRVY